MNNSRFKRFKIVSYGNGMRTDDKKFPMKTDIKHVNACSSMAAHSSMPLFRKASMNDMHTSVECLVLESISLNIARKVINMCMEWAVALDVHHIRTNRAIRVLGSCHIFHFSSLDLDD